MRRTVLLYLGIVLTLGCVKRTEMLLPGEWPEHMHRSWGFAAWDCNEPLPVAFIRIDKITNSEVIRHEMAHLQQMVGLGCEGWTLLMKHPPTRDSLELDAQMRARASR